MDTKGRKKVLTELDAERYELERKAAEREKQAQRLQVPKRMQRSLSAQPAPAGEGSHPTPDGHSERQASKEKLR